MRRNVWLAVVLAVALPFVLFTASCTKNVVQAKPVLNEPEVQKEPETPVEKVEEAAQPVDEKPVEEASREPAETAFVNENVHFALDSSILSGQARQTLNSMADYLRTNPDITITIEGHCDDRGTDEYNIALGDRRAETVRIYLGDLGIGTSRLNTVSYGEERPIAMGYNEASWAKNRRAQFVIN